MIPMQLVLGPVLLILDLGLFIFPLLFHLSTSRLLLCRVFFGNATWSNHSTMEEGSKKEGTLTMTKENGTKSESDKWTHELNETWLQAHWRTPRNRKDKHDG